MLAAIAAALLLALGLAPWLLPSSWLRAAAAAEIQRCTGLACEIAAARFSWWRGITLFQVRLGAPRAPVFTAPRLHLQVSLLSLWQDQIVVRRLETEGAEISLVRNAEGNLNVELTPPSAAPLLPQAQIFPLALAAEITSSRRLRLAAEEVLIVKSRLRYEDKAAGIDTNW
ncbi:MAG: AsmA family protein, partial [Planctomycetota bacterium]|nr:AsmA family protein [Planctomycetota bacterium]